VVLDLNGCILSQTVNQTGNYSMIQNDGDLTILDSKGNGKITYIDSGNGSNYISNTITNRGTLTVKSGSVENNSSEAMANVGFAYAIDSSILGEATETVTNIEGGTVKSIYSPLRVRADSQTENVIANISGGEIYGRIDHQMSSSKAGVKGTLNISGGTFYPYGIKSNAAIMVFGAGLETDASGIVLNVAGGTFQVPITIYRGDYVPLGQGFNEKFITGGTFNYDPTANLADGYITVAEDGNYVVYKAVAAIGETKYKSIEDAIAAVEESATIKVLCDAEMAGNAKIAEGKTVVIDLNGCTISAVDNTEKSYQIIQNTGNLTIKNSADNTAKMTVKATINSGWSRYSAVIANTVGGTLTVEENVLLEHLGGTDMAYGIDNLTNGKGTSAVTTINGATVKSPYRAVRQFLNGIEATNELYVKAGSELRGDNKSIFFHDPSKNANTGKLVVESGAELYGDVYLFVTEGSTEWPVEVSIAASTLADASEVLSGNVPSGYAIIKDNETWKVVDNAIATVEEFKAFRNKINAGEKFSDKTAYLVADIDLNGEEWIPIGTKNNHFHGTFDGQGHTISNFKITQKHDGDNAQAALFGTVSLTTVFKNFNIDNIQVLYPADYNGDYYGAAVIGTFYGNVTLQNINVTKSTIQGNNKVAGLIAHDGSSSSVLIENCNVNGCTIETKNEEDGGNVGGLVGLFQNTEATVKNCSVTGCTINAINSSDSGKRGNALLIGGTIDATPANLYVKIDNCKVADNTFNETGRVNYVSPYGDGTLVGGAREGDSYVIGKVEIDGVVYPQN
ncbi:MAG: hypothetical protein IJE85_04640, partial [Bacteroidales bacterium]|nr:hypothetical protein [Bacteroidales bacterium]